MRILLCHNFYQIPGGEDEVFRSEKNLLEEQGHTVEEFTRHNDDIAKIPNWKVALATLWNRHTTTQLQQKIKDFQPELMHCTNTFPLISPSAYYAAKRQNVKVVQSIHNFRFACMGGMCERDGELCVKCVGRKLPLPGIQHRCYRGSLVGSCVMAGYQMSHRAIGTWRRAVDRFILLSNFNKKCWLDAGMPAQSVSVKPNFVQHDPGFNQTGGDNFVFAGRLAPEKGLPVLLKAWEKAVSDGAVNTEQRLVIFGDGPLRPLVESEAQKQTNIDYRGWVAQHEVQASMQSARAVIVPTTSYEPFGLVVIQAFAGGTPVIASDRGTLDELVSAGESGWKFKAGAPDSLAQQISECVNAPIDTYLSMRSASRQQFLAKYTPQSNYEQLLAIYETTLGTINEAKGPHHVASQS